MATSTFISWDIHFRESQHYGRSLTIQRPPHCEEAQASYMERERNAQLFWQNHPRHQTCNLKSHLENSNPGRCYTEKNWGSQPKPRPKVQTYGPKWAILVIFSYSNWSPTPLWSRDEPFLMCTAQILDPQIIGITKCCFKTLCFGTYTYIEPKN